MKVNQLKIKKIVYENNKLYALNNIDKDILDENSEFLLASITKLFTSIGILILQEEKKLNINDNLGKYLSNKQLSKTKLIDIINHNAGLKESDDKDIYEGSKIKYNSSSDFYESYKSEELITTKKGQFSYSNIGYEILGVVIEKVSNMSYEKFITLKILKPLNMSQTSFVTKNKTNINLYNNTFKKLTKFQSNALFNYKSSAGLKSTIADLIKFKEFTKLLKKNSLNLIPNYMKNVNNLNTISIWGNTYGGSSHLKIEYDKFWQFKNILIWFQTPDL